MGGQGKWVFAFYFTPTFIRYDSLSASWGFCQGTIVTLQFSALATRRE